MANDDASEISEIYSINTLSSKATEDPNNNIQEIKSRATEVSILSGILDDNKQDNDYTHTAVAELEILKQLTKTETGHREGNEASNYGEDGKGKSESSIINDSEEEIKDTKSPVDQGYAWLMAICGMLAVFSTWGANAGYGVFLAHYINTHTFSGATEYDFALIGGLVVFLAQALAPFCLLLYKVLGPTNVFFIGLFLQTCGFLLASFATKIWQLYLTQGVLIGVSFSFVFIPTTLVVPTWFDRKRATAMGILASGAGLGGIFFSLTVNKIIQRTGNQHWALRMCCFVTLFTGTIACSLLRPRNYKAINFKETITKNFIVANAKASISLYPFKKYYSMVLLTIWFGLSLMAYVVLLFSMSSFARSVGLSAQQGTDLTAILNAAQLVGRPCSGAIADKMGRYNFATTICLFLAIMVFAYWINVTSFAALIVFNILMGLVIGVGNIMAQPLARDILEEEDSNYLAAGWSGVNIISSPFPLVAEVCALALRDTKLSKPFLHAQIFVGCCYVACFIIILVVRETMVRQLLRKRLEISEFAISDHTKGGYLKNPDTEIEDLENLQNRVERYRLLLKPNIKWFIIRTFYPVRI